MTSQASKNKCFSSTIKLGSLGSNQIQSDLRISSARNLSYMLNSKFCKFSLNKFLIILPEISVLQYVCSQEMLLADLPFSAGILKGSDRSTPKTSPGFFHSHNETDTLQVNVDCVHSFY